MLKKGTRYDEWTNYVHKKRSIYENINETYLTEISCSPRAHTRAIQSKVLQVFFFFSILFLFLLLLLPLLLFLLLLLCRLLLICVRQILITIVFKVILTAAPQIHIIFTSGSEMWFRFFGRWSR